MLTLPKKSLLQIEADRIEKYLTPLDENELRKILYLVFYKTLSNSNIVDYHGIGEHGSDLFGVIDANFDPFGKVQVFMIQIKCGKLTLPKWRKDLCSQLAEVFCSTTLPRQTSEDNSRRIKREWYDSSKYFNRRKMPRQNRLRRHDKR